MFSNGQIIALAKYESSINFVLGTIVIHIRIAGTEAHTMIVRIINHTAVIFSI